MAFVQTDSTGPLSPLLDPQERLFRKMKRFSSSIPPASHSHLDGHATLAVLPDTLLSERKRKGD